MSAVSDYTAYLQAQDFYYVVLLLCGVPVAYMLHRRRGGAVRLPVVPLWFVLSVAAIAPLFRLVAVPLWYDETFTVAAAGGALSDLWAVVLSDVHTPLHYFLIHVWGQIFGFSQIAVRLPSWFVGVVCVYMAYKLARVYLSRSAASWSALLVAIFPAVVYYSSEGRYPIFLLLSVLVALYAVERKKRYAWVVCAVPAWWHIVAAPYSIMLLLYGRNHYKGWQLFIGGLLSCLFLPLALYQSADVINGFWLKLRFPLFHLTQNFFIQQNELIFPLLILLGVFIALSFRWSLRWFLLIWFVPASVWIISALVAPVYLFRVLLPSVVLLIIIAGGRLLQWNRLAAAVLLLFVGSLLMYYTGQGRVDIPSVLSVCSDSDYVATTSTGLYILVRAHSSLPVYSYGVNTNSQYLTDTAKKAIRMSRPPDGGRGCLLMYDNFETLPIERIFTVRRSLVAAFSAGKSTQLKVFK